MKFENFAQEGNLFLKEVAIELGEPNDTDHAYRVMRSVLHTVRDILTPEESLHMISQLPLILKGVYADGWKIRETKRMRSMEDFLESLREKSDRSAGRDFGDNETARHHTRSVLKVLKRHISKGEVQDMIDQFPMVLAELWLSDEKTAQH